MHHFPVYLFVMPVPDAWEGKKKPGTFGGPWFYNPKD